MTTLLSVNNYFYRYGGAETVFFEHNRLFEAKGWSVVPFAMRHPRNADTTWSEYFVDRIEYGEPYSLAEAGSEHHASSIRSIRGRSLRSCLPE